MNFKRTKEAKTKKQKQPLTKKKLITYIIIGTLVIVGLVLLLINTILTDSSDPEVVANFCENNPTAIICTDEDATYLQAADEIFTYLVTNYSSGLDEDFCNDFLYGNIADYCNSTTIRLLPDNIDMLSTDYRVTEISEGIFDYETRNAINHELEWIFRVSVVKNDGIYLLSGLSYRKAPELVDITLTNMEIDILMTSIISESDDDLEDYCSTYFIGDALASCNVNANSIIPDPLTTFNYSVSKIATNFYTYTVESEDGLTRYEYTVLLEKSEDVLYVTRLEVVEILD